MGRGRSPSAQKAGRRAGPCHPGAPEPHGFWRRSSFCPRWSGGRRGAQPSHAGGQTRPGTHTMVVHRDGCVLRLRSAGSVQQAVSLARCSGWPAELQAMNLAPGAAAGRTPPRTSARRIPSQRTPPASGTWNRKTARLFNLREFVNVADSRRLNTPPIAAITLGYSMREEILEIVREITGPLF